MHCEGLARAVTLAGRLEEFPSSRAPTVTDSQMLGEINIVKIQGKSSMSVERNRSHFSRRKVSTIPREPSSALVCAPSTTLPTLDQIGGRRW